MRTFVLPAVLLLAGCAGSPVPPDWQANAQEALRKFSAAYYAGNTRLAVQEFARARAEIASTGRPDLLARAELVRCAARVASLEFDDCAEFQALAADAGAEERTYAAFLAGRWQGLDAALLPAQHRALLADADADLPGLRIRCRDVPSVKAVSRRPASPPPPKPHPPTAGAGRCSPGWGSRPRAPTLQAMAPPPHASAAASI